jgi:hypothetical protein
MLKTLIRLSDGREISSGVNESMNIRSCTITQCCNSGDDLTIGSVCAACVEMVVEAPDNTFRSDDVFTLYKVDDAGNRTQIGIFNVFAPEKKSDHLYKITAYDNVIKLDTDLSDWLLENIAFLSDPRSFVSEVCRQCGVVFSYKGFYFDDDIHRIPYFEPNGPVTGRKLLQWIGEMCGYFCIADAYGYICFKWYSAARVDLSETDKWVRFQGGCKFNNHIMPCDGVRLIFGTDSRQFPFRTLNNPYIIKDNPILQCWKDSGWTAVAELLAKKFEELDELCTLGEGYLAACEAAVQSTNEIEVGDIVIFDRQSPAEDGKPTPYISMLVMTKKTFGQRCVIKCTGSYRRRN